LVFWQGSSIQSKNLDEISLETAIKLDELKDIDFVGFLFGYFDGFSPLL
jgi:hypothetical protein